MRTLNHHLYVCGIIDLSYTITNINTNLWGHSQPSSIWEETGFITISDRCDNASVSNLYRWSFTI